MAQLLEFVIRERGLLRRDITQDMRSTASEVLETSITTNQRGVVFVNSQEFRITHGCVYEKNYHSKARIILLRCEGSESENALFVLCLRLQNCEYDLRSVDAQFEHLFQMDLIHLVALAVDPDELKAFSKACLFRDPNGKTVSVCRGRSRPPSSGRR